MKVDSQKNYDKDLPEYYIKEAEDLMKILSETLSIIFSKIDSLVQEKRNNLVEKYVKALAIDMVGKFLTFPGINQQEAAASLSSWIKSRYNLNISIIVDK